MYTQGLFSAHKTRKIPLKSSIAIRWITFVNFENNMPGLRSDPRKLSSKKKKKKKALIVYIKSSHTVRDDYPDVLTFMDKMLILIVCNSLAHYVYTRFNTCSVFANAELNVMIFFELHCG